MKGTARQFGSVLLSLQHDGCSKSFCARRGPCSAAVGGVSGLAFQIGGVVCEAPPARRPAQAGLRQVSHLSWLGELGAARCALRD